MPPGVSIMPITVGVKLSRPKSFGSAAPSLSVVLLGKLATATNSAAFRTLSTNTVVRGLSSSSTLCVPGALVRGQLCCYNLVTTYDSGTNSGKIGRRNLYFDIAHCAQPQEAGKQAIDRRPSKSHGSLLEEVLAGKGEASSTAEKAKEYGKDASYLVFIVGGLLLVGGLAYAIFSELFSKTSPTVIYSNALKMVMNDDQVAAALGDSIKGFGEETRRGRRRHVTHAKYDDGKHRGMNVKFYVKGSQAKGTVYVDMREDEYGNLDYRYIVVDVDGFPPRKLMVLDRR